MWLEFVPGCVSHQDRTLWRFSELSIIEQENPFLPKAFNVNSIHCTKRTWIDFVGLPQQSVTNQVAYATEMCSLPVLEPEI